MEPNKTDARPSHRRLEVVEHSVLLGAVADAGRRGRVRVGLHVLDNLVGALASQQSLKPGWLDAVRDMLLGLTDGPLVLEGDVVYAAGERVPQSGGASVQWVRRAYEAGLRDVSARPGLRSQDVLAWAAMLAQATMTPIGRVRLEDALWAGMPGFRFGLRPTAEDLLLALPDATIAATAQRRGFLAHAGQLLQRLGQPSDNVDLAAQRDTEAVDALVRDGRAVLAGPEVTRLRARAEDCTFWARQTLLLGLTRPDLQPTLNVPGLALAIADVAALDFDAYLAIVHLLGASQDAYLRGLAASVDEVRVGSLIVGESPLTPARLATCAKALGCGNARIVRDVVAALLERAAADGGAAETAVTRLAAGSGEAAWTAALDVARLSPAARDISGRVLLAAGFSIESLVHAVAGMRGAALADLLGRVAPEAVAPLAQAALAALSTTAPRDRPGLIELLVTHGGPQLCLDLVTILETRSTEDWDARSARLIARAAVRHGGTERLVRLQRRRDIPLPVRLGLLEGLAEHPEAAEEALRWRATEVLDAPEIRARMKALREGTT